MSTANKAQNVPGPDLPSPKLKICDSFLPMVTNEDRPLEFTRIHSHSQARSEIISRVDSTRNNKISLPIELVERLIDDYDRLDRDYKSLVEMYEQQGSTLTCEKLDKYIEIADQVIKMNDLTLEELNKKHELLKNSRKAWSGKNIDSREDILEGNIKMESDRSEIRERKFGDEMIGSNEERTKGIKENHRGNGVGKKIPNQGEVPENEDKQVSKNRHKVGSNERGEENFGVGSSKTDYAVERIEDGAEIVKVKNNMNGKDDKVVYTKENDSHEWSDQVNARYDENEGKDEDDWMDEDDWLSENIGDNSKEVPTSKKGGHGNHVRENKNSRNRSYRERNLGRNGNNRRRQNDNRN